MYKSLPRVAAEELPKRHQRKSGLVEVGGQFRLRIQSRDLAGTVQQAITKRAMCRLQGCNSLQLLQHFLRQKWSLHMLIL